VELLPEARHDPLLAPLPDRFTGFGWHSYEFPLPPEATALARSPVCLQAYRLEGPAWGFQFHAEVTGDSVDAWLRKYREDEDAVRAGVDPEALRAETARRIGGWNELGRALCARFLDRGVP
jgi:GMP synthase-like glutamine amidotransferase